MSNQWDRIRKSLSPLHQLQAATVAVGTMTAMATPVLNGGLKASWNFAVGAPDKSIHDGGRDSLGVLRTDVNDFNLGNVAYFVNAQPYAKRIEYDGHSQQAPAGMMRISIAHWQKINDDIARANR